MGVVVGCVLGRFSDGKLPCASVRFVPDTHAVSHCVSPDLCGGPARTHGDRAAASSQFWSTEFLQSTTATIRTLVHTGRPSSLAACSCEPSIVTNRSNRSPA